MRYLSESSGCSIGHIYSHDAPPSASSIRVKQALRQARPVRALAVVAM
jgi:hypothetical protein